jgi:hypothetical protein
MALLVLLGILLVLVALPITYAVTNPVVGVADDLTTTTPYVEVDSELATMLANTRGYEIQVLAAGTYALSYRRAPAWALVLGLLTFPFGILIILFSRERLTLTFSATAIGSGTRLLVFGRVHEKLARATGAAVQLRLDRLRAAPDDEAQPHF